MYKSWSMYRFDMLDRLCLTWQGWVSAAVYLPLDHNSHAHLHNTVAKLDALHAALEKSGKLCTFSLPFNSMSELSKYSTKRH